MFFICRVLVREGTINGAEYVKIYSKLDFDCVHNIFKHIFINKDILLFHFPVRGLNVLFDDDLLIIIVQKVQNNIQKNIYGTKFILIILHFAAN